MIYERRLIISDKAAKAWDDAYNYRPAPPVLEVPWVSYAIMAAVGTALFIALMLIWPNP